MAKSNHKKRQWGTEKHAFSLPHLHTKPTSWTIALSRISIVLTIVFWLMYVSSVIFKQLIENPQNYQLTMESIGYLIVVTFLTFSALMYLIARQGALLRFAKHIRVPKAILDSYFSKKQPSITVLVPSYKEEAEVIKKTLLSAALQEYPSLKIVLLLDDDPKKLTQQDVDRIKATEHITSEIHEFLQVPLQRFTPALKDFKQKHKNKSVVSNQVVQQLAGEYFWAAQYLKNSVDQEKINDHVDEFFNQEVLIKLATDFELVAEALMASSIEKTQIAKERILQLYQRLVWIFSAQIELFERKQYASLSHEANKAMNLNAYIGLMGGNYKTEETPAGTILLPTNNKSQADLIVPDSDYILTLDADSILLKEYCLRLVYLLEQPTNKHVAVTQTPYSSFRGAGTRIERLSGATTDIQHILHQGMTYYGATFWVGANAVIRKKALEDIAKTEWSGGFEVKRYIQDNTVIEDTESSIDMALHGWQLINYPERLSYSATPPDFGSLVVQRRRWANGGLLILPKLLTQIRSYKRQQKAISVFGFLLRINYMASIAWSNFGLIFLLAYPYDGRLLSPLVLLAAMPYFIAQATDLKYCKYKYSDIIRIYGFNLILLPVNLAGVIKSMQQALTAKKIPFARTPKVKNRTATGWPFVVAPLLIIGFSLFTFWRNIEGENWGNAAFAAFNALAATWATLSYIGIKNLLVDLFLGLISYLYVEDSSSKKSKHALTNNPVDWKVVLYHGDTPGTLPHGSLKELIGHKKSTIKA